MIREALSANPVAHKDLRTLMRAWRASFLLCSYLIVMATPALVFLLRQSGTTDQAVNGSDLFRALAVVQLFLILTMAPIAVAASMRAEHADRTWDLMIMTRLSAFQIVWGKFFTGVAFQLLLALSVLPLYAVALVFGAAGISDLLRTFLVLSATIFVCCALGLVGRGAVRSYASVCLGSAFILTPTGLLSFLILSVGDDAHISIGAVTVAPQLTRLAPLDPLAGLAAALPHAGAAEPLAGLQNISYPFGLQAGIAVWVAYCLCCLAVSFGLLTLATRGVGRKYMGTSAKGI